MYTRKLIDFFFPARQTTQTLPSPGPAPKAEFDWPPSAEDLEAGAMWPTNRAYTDFLVRTAADGDLADLVAALLPCAWGYAWIGRRLAEERRPADRRYADWIEQYASPEFQQAAAWLREEMDRLAADAPAARRERLRDLFLLSSRYEWMFWEMCWRGEAWAV